MIDIHPYQMQAKSSLNSKASQTLRQGALIRCKFDAETVGYADCHPWPELGDMPLEYHLKSLQNGQHTSIIKQSMHCAKVDGNARKENRNLFEGLTIPSSQYLISSLECLKPSFLNTILNQGFTHIKAKLSPAHLLSADRLIKLIMTAEGQSFRWRLDFNEALTFESFLSFLRAIEPALPSIDFIEDPFPYCPKLWQICQESYPVYLACDRDALKAKNQLLSARYVVFKPAIASIDDFISITKQKIIVTSYMDHPLGQLYAAYNAAKLYKFMATPHFEVCGLLTHLVYKPGPFSSLFSENTPVIIPPQGTGLGFDTILEKLSWQRI